MFATRKCLIRWWLITTRILCQLQVELEACKLCVVGLAMIFAKPGPQQLSASAPRRCAARRCRHASLEGIGQNNDMEHVEAVKELPEDTCWLINRQLTARLETE